MSETPIDAKAAAEYLHIHEDTVRERARAGQIPGYKPGRKWIFYPSELEAYAKTQKPECHSTDARTRRTCIADLKSVERKLGALLGRKIERKPPGLKIVSGGRHGGK